MTCVARFDIDNLYPSLHDASTQCWAHVVDGWPTLGGCCVVFAGMSLSVGLNHETLVMQCHG